VTGETPPHRHHHPVRRPQRTDRARALPDAVRRHSAGGRYREAQSRGDWTEPVAARTHEVASM